MRFGGRRTSDNVESRSGGGGLGLGGGGGGLLMLAPMLIRFVFSRFGIVGVIVLIGLMFLLMGNPFGSGSQQAVGPQQTQTAAQGSDQVCATDETRQFLCQVLASTEDKWGEMFRAAGRNYTPPRLVFYPGSVATECGSGQAAMGPFYCPSDQRIYLDTSFFDELSRRHGAPGDFAQAYVVAHEVGHHVQTITGTSDAIRQAQSAVGRGEANALQVRMELQADCYAGLWAAQERGAMEPGDLEEGMTAAAAIGDDTLQRAGQGMVVPESFTHGTSAQRQQALMRGFNGAGPAACDVYMQGV